MRRLGDALLAFAPLWRPRPWHERRPAWCAAHPVLAAQLLALDDAGVEALSRDDGAILSLLARHLPAAREVAELTRLRALPAAALRDPGRHFDWGIPGRKRAQIEAFCAAAGAPVADVVDWCAGKGHLGRFIAAQWGVAVHSMELDAALVADGEHLARRARQAGQRFAEGDLLAADAARGIEGRHVVALHACGDLHRALVRLAEQGGVRALDLAPCCPHRTEAAVYEPFTPSAPLDLTRDDLRLAVTGTRTASARETRLRQRMNAWKLGWLALSGDGAARPLRPVPPHGLALGFEGFCRQLAQREGIALGQAPDWRAAEAAGWSRASEVARLSLARFAFRRALEVWLALDMACRLESAGYRVRLGEFCPPALTPRNLLLAARRD